jgi:2-methylisocitrate lyase-like PEP mutase family enzyme
MVAAGAPAIATTSAGVANALGLPDGEALGRDAMLDVVRRVVEAVPDVPVTADLEGGYGDPARTVALARAAGAVGFNLEDGVGGGQLRPLPSHLRVLESVRVAAGPDMYMNARTDAVWLGLPDAAAITVERARAYAAAGADGVFVPGAKDPALLKSLVDAVSGFSTTINVLAVPGLPPLSELSALGVTRVSSGSGPARAALSVAYELAREVLEDGTFDAATSASVSYAEANAIMRGEGLRRSARGAG